MRRLTCGVAVVLMVFAAGCGAGDTGATPGPSAGDLPSSAAPSPAPTSPATTSPSLSSPAPSSPAPNSPSSPPKSDGPSTEPAEGAAELLVVYSADGTSTTNWTLTCDPNGGSHPAVVQACATLDEVGAAAFAPVAADVACTQVYGGPQTATVTGTVAGQTVNASFDRADGCEIERWAALVPLLPAPQN